MAAEATPLPRPAGSCAGVHRRGADARLGPDRHIPERRLAALGEQRGERRPDRLAGDRAPRGVADKGRAVPQHRAGHRCGRPPLLSLLALLLPARDRERFVIEATEMVGNRTRWQRLNQLLSLAGAMPGIAVVLRWARRRRA
jgi:hypothetical protein